MDYQQVKKIFDYHPDGYFIWKIASGYKIKSGNIAGIKNNKTHVQIQVFGKNYQLHRLIWLWHYGYIPENMIDHIDKDPSNNKIENLREASKQCNARNCGNHRHNTSSVKGVSFYSRDKKWSVQIKINGKPKYIGRFKDFDEAVLHRLAGEQCLEWEGCDSCSPAYEYAIKHGLIKGVQNYDFTSGISSEIIR